MMVREMEIWKPKLGEQKAPSSLCLCQYPLEVSHCSHNRISVRIEEDMNFITCYVFLSLKYDRNYNWKDFHTIRKMQMQSCGKTRLSTSTSQAREINSDKELTILRLRNVSRKECGTIVHGNQHSFQLNSLVIFP